MHNYIRTRRIAELILVFRSADYFIQLLQSDVVSRLPEEQVS